jgi:predicted ATPase
MIAGTVMPNQSASTKLWCTCAQQHIQRRIVLTGGPGAGKTAVLEMLRHELCHHVVMARESAGILFGGGFPRGSDVVQRRAAQRAIYHIQLELETIADATNAALTLCDRGVVDGCAYWPGPDDYWAAVGTTREAALARYDTVIHLRTPNGANGYGHQNPLRTESAFEAGEIDRRILAAWESHPRRFLIDATPNFLGKAERALTIVRQEVPDCCRRIEIQRDVEARLVPTVQSSGGSATTSTGQLAP